MEAQEIFDRLWIDYTKENPHAKGVFDAFVKLGENVVNDHIAFRTFDDQRVSVDVLARPFLECGYEFKGNYIFTEKHLFAKHYEHTSIKEAPRVFISQLVVRDFSPFLQDKIKQIIDEIPIDNLQSDDLIYSGRLWDKPSYEVYEKLRSESEYAAWVYVWGFRANHFTVSVNMLKTLNTIEKVNQFVKDQGYLLNDSGGEIKGTPAQLLEQSSTKAGIVKMDFAEGVFDVPSCYYEFARRYEDADGEIYSGFIAKSADKIFESTDFYKK